ncbi:MAG TPA: ATP-dependent DNA ligase [Verrucomicrobiae bacterium]|nr:ATP-dependent DNA ligase [Verrucomicrobiae bacterium]
MEALLVDDLPIGDGWQYEPKWDGFRCLIFRDGKEVYLQSKAGQPLARYFPELVEAVLALKADRFVVDGEIAVPLKERLSFDDLLQRIHPAASRIQRLSKETPAIFIAFDLLVADGESIVDKTLESRRTLLEQFAKKTFPKNRQIRLSPASTDLRVAQKWFNTVGTDLDGIIAKRTDMQYRSGERTGMQKMKRIRTADCVVGGFRYGSKAKKLVGSLLLGLYDDDGALHHVGFCSGIRNEEKPALTKKLEALIRPPGFTGRAPGGPSRWSTERSTEWQPLKPKLVVEVSYDHFTGGRFRHGTSLIRWRPDKAPTQCKMDQVAPVGRGALALL